LRWYDRNRRDLPWRADRDPYRIWLSEIMLQQTRVSAVVEYYRRFLARFPTVHDLASARLPSVLAAWSGLGYYRRARALHAAAKQIVHDRKGAFPKSAEEWRRLPGIGRYTSAAIASIALDEAVAVVDGNVERVLQRLTGNTLFREEQWTKANALLDRTRPGDFNQAMMELGATICLPRTPLCAACPISSACITRNKTDVVIPNPGALTNTPDRVIATPAALNSLRDGVIPKPGALSSRARDLACSATIPRVPSTRQKREVHYALDQRDNAVFLVQRSRHCALMPGMWELPEMSQTNGARQPFLTVKHAITVTDYTVHVVRAKAAKARTGRAIPVVRLPALPLTGLARKILRAARII
jgi:A/G-specific adenine glycosylase